MDNITAKSPPVGVKPGWLCAAQRISELAGAIQRYADDEDCVGRRYLIGLWSDEIRMQLDIWDMVTNKMEEQLMSSED